MTIMDRPLRRQLKPINCTLTPKQRRVLDEIKKGCAEGVPPTIREICSAVGVSSSSTVWQHIRTLKAKGYIEVEADKPRSMRLVQRVDWRKVRQVLRSWLDQAEAGSQLYQDTVEILNQMEGR